MYPAGNLFIPVAHGRLEAILKEPRQGEGSPRGVALVLHPHPLHGGTMHNKVVFRAARGLEDAGHIALRINFRGVGASTGTHDHARGGEQQDARDALDHLAANYPDIPITLAGFSFGARVALEVGIEDPRVSRLIGIGTPVNMDYDFGFLQNCRKPLLLVHGQHDEFGDPAKLQATARQLSPDCPVRLEIIPGAGHFFDQQLEDLRRVIAEWAKEEVSDRE